MTKGSIRTIRQDYLPLLKQLGEREFQRRNYGDKIPGKLRDRARLIPDLIGVSRESDLTIYKKFPDYPQASEQL